MSRASSGRCTTSSSRNQQALEDAEPREVRARSIGLNVDKWKADLDSRQVRRAHQGQDQALAQQLGASGTPSFFINGRKLSGAQPIETFKARHRRGARQGPGAGRRAARRPTRSTPRIMDKAGSAPRRRPAAGPGRAARAARDGKVDVPGRRAGRRARRTPRSPSSSGRDFQCPFCSRVAPDAEADRGHLRQGRAHRLPQPAAALPPERAARPPRPRMAAQRAGQVLGDARQAVRQPAGARSRRRSRSTRRRSASTWASSRRRSTPASSPRRRSRPTRRPAARSARSGTPTFFINGRQFVGAQPFEAFKGVIDEEIKKADALLTTGVKLGEPLRRAAEGRRAKAAARRRPRRAAAEPKVVTDIDVGSARR